jgi:prevent-host-death family protein
VSNATVVQLFLEPIIADSSIWRRGSRNIDLVIGLSYTDFVATIVNIHEAKTHFSKLLAQVSAGEEIIIAKAGKPVARLAPIEPKAAKKRVPGIDKGKIWMSDDFDVMSERELEEWYRVDNRLK